MVTPNETNVSSEVDSSPEVTESLPEADAPLIPADFDDRYDQPEATEEETPSGDETASDDSETQPEETSETTDEVTAEPEEAPEATTTETPEATEEQSSEPRTYSQEEWGNRESSYRQRDTEQQKQVADLQASVAQMQQSFNDQVLDAEVRGYEQSIQAQLVADGNDEGTAARIASQQANAAKASYLAQQEANQLRQQLNQSTAEQETTARNASVDRYMRDHNVPEEHRELLQGYTDPALMVKAAEVLGNAEALKTETKTAKLAEVPSGGEANTFDSPTGSVGNETDAQWLDKYNSGVYDSPADDAKAVKILAARGIAMPFGR